MSAIEEKTIDIFGATLTRSKFVKGSGALVAGFSLMGAGVGAKAAKAAGTTPDPTLPSSWLEIRPDNTITLKTGKAEMGQGSASTAYAQITAEELNVPYSAITEVIMGDTDRTPDGGFSAGYIVPAGGNARKAAAYVYQALLSVASTQLGVPVANLTVTNGVVSGGGKNVSYGDLVKNQQFNLTIPVTGSLQSLFGVTISGNPPTKPVSQYKIVGTSVPMRTIPPIVSGQATYVGDVRLPGMLHARVVHPPTLGSKLVSVGKLDKKQFPDTQIVVQGNLVAVVDPIEYQAIQAASVLAGKTKWTKWEGLPGSGNLFSAMRKLDWTTTPQTTGVKTGNADAAFAGAATKLSASYEFPFEKHAPIGPTCAVGDYRPDGTVYVHMHGQNPNAMRWLIAMMLNTPIDKVVVRWYDGSGHYGRSNGGETGAESEAVLLSKAVGKPVRLQWMRWEDMQWSTQHPPAFSDVQAGLDSGGKLVAYRVNHYMPAMQDDRHLGALLAGLPTISAPNVTPYPGTFGSTPNGISDPWVYDQVPNALQVGYGTFQIGTDPKAADFNTQIGMRDHSMRTPAQRQQNFAQESMMSELAAAAKVDQVQFRINNTSDPRVINVMKAVRDNSSWWETRPSPNPKAKSSAGELIGQGASQMTRASAVWGCAAKVVVNPKTGKVRVTDVTTVGDVGILVNPLQQKRMMEGGVVMGVSEALHEQVTFNKGTITSRDWVTFPILRMIDSPKIKTVIITNQTASGGSMGTAFGMGGEGPNGYIAAAIANAIFDATGKQPRRLPFTPRYMRKLLSS
jgi:CO/xanthine dehydrogenase Mo-binding subunit